MARPTAWVVLSLNFQLSSKKMSGDEVKEATAGEEIAAETKVSMPEGDPTGGSIESEVPFGMPSRTMGGK